MKKVLLILSLTTLFVSCRKEATRWNTDWVAPIVNDTLTLMNLVNDSTLSVNNAGYYDVNLKRQLFRFDLNSIVGIPDTTLQNNFFFSAALNVPPGYSFVNKTEERDLKLGSIELQKIHLKKGRIKIALKNPYETKVFVSITLPGVKKNGQVMNLEVEMAAGSVSSPSTATGEIDLSGAQMDLTGISGGGHNKLTSQITVTSDPNGPTVLTTISHVTQINATIEGIELEYAKGYFGNQVLSDTLETDVALLKKWVDGTIDLPNMSLGLRLINGVKVNGKINLRELITTKENGVSTSLTSSQINVPQNVNSATGSWSSLSPSETVYNFQAGNSNIQTFLENAGSKIKVVYDFEINPLGNITGSWNEVFPQSAVVLDLNLNMPLALSLDHFTIADTFNLDLSKYEKQIQQGRGADFTISLQNSFPVSGKFMLQFISKTGEIIAAFPEYKAIQSGVYGVMNDEGVKVESNQILWRINESEFKNLKDCNRVALTAVFDTPDPSNAINSSVLFGETDFLVCKLLMGIQYENKYE